MKQILFLLFFSITSIIWSDSLYFRSNELGLELERISRFRLDEFEYVLEIKKEATKTTKLLYQNQKIWKIWEIIFDKQGRMLEEYEYENNKILKHNVFDKKERLAIEEFYKGGRLVQKKIYAYGTRGIDFIITQDGIGNELYVDEFKLSSSGRLRFVFRKYANGRLAIIHFRFGEGRLLGEWEYSEGQILESFYDKQGKLVRVEEWQSDTLLRSKDYKYDLKGKLMLEIENDHKNNLQIKKYYDENGKLISEKQSGLEKEDVEIVYQYKNKLKISMRKKSKIGVEEWRYSYNADDSLAKEEYLRQGFLIMRTFYPTKNERIEEYFREEELFMRVYFKAEKKVKEEFILDGEVVRTKEY